jgi:hypothetical protein
MRTWNGGAANYGVAAGVLAHANFGYMGAFLAAQNFRKPVHELSSTGLSVDLVKLVP